jgi:hypothetical protein
MVFVSGYAVPPGNEIRHRLANKWNAGTLAVRAGARWMAIQDVPYPGNDVSRESGHGLWVAKQLGEFEEAESLAKKRDRALFKGLRITDVAVDDLLPLLFQLLGTEHDRPAHSVLGIKKTGTEILQSQHT